MMGNPEYADDAPIMCYNPAKMYQLGWYSAYETSLTGLTTWSGNLYSLAAAVNYKSVPSGGIMFLRYSDTNTDYYLGFNQQAGVNSGVVEGGNTVTVITRPSGTGYDQSWLQAKLSAGGVYQVTLATNYILTVTVNSINLNGNYASITLTASTTAPPPASPPTSPSTSPPTRPPTSPPNQQQCTNSGAPCTNNSQCCSGFCRVWASGTCR